MSSSIINYDRIEQFAADGERILLDNAQKNVDNGFGE